MLPSNRGHSYIKSFKFIYKVSKNLWIYLYFQVPILMVQASLDGILLGILFALIAYGMALQWGVMNIINIAQGDFGNFLVGYITYFMYLSGIHPALGVIVAPAIMYFVGVGLYKISN